MPSMMTFMSDYERDRILHDRLQSIVVDLDRCWKVALNLRSGQATWAAIAPALSKYGSAGALLEEWYVDWQLASCRRLLDQTGGRAVSLVKALRRLHRVAPDVTVNILVDIWSQTPSDRSRAEIESGVRRQLRGITAQEPATVERLTKRAVKLDEEALLRTHTDVVKLANVRVAHMDTQPPELNVSSHDVDQLLNDVFEIVGRWVSTLKGTHLVNKIDARLETPAVTRALELFDWGEYVVSLSDAQHTYGVAQPPGLAEQLEAEVTLRYEWPDLHD